MNLQDLNTPQQAAITCIDKPCLVLAGAGSGKTRVITYKIAWLIERAGYLPNKIRALTFTNKSAREMRQSIDDLLGKIEEGKTQDVNLIVKADVKGSLMPLRTVLERLGNDEVRAKIIHAAVGYV